MHFVCCTHTDSGIIDWCSMYIVHSESAKIQLYFEMHRVRTCAKKEHIDFVMQNRFENIND